MCKEAVMTVFKALTWHVPAGTENHKNLSQDSLSPGLHLNLGPPEYEQECQPLDSNV
jgi:hypothetical protein